LAKATRGETGDRAPGIISRLADESTPAQLEIDPAVGTVEMKITARARDQDEVLEALEQAHIEHEARDVYFDTTDLTLFEAGIVLRARRVHDGADDSTVKLRPVESKSIGERWKADPKLEFEVDAIGDNYVSSAKLSADQDRGEIDEVARGERSVRSLFSGDQEQFLGDYVPGGALVDWDRLRPLGPVNVHKWEFEPKDLGYEMTVEEWVLPDRSDLVEISITVDPNKAVEANERFVDFLRSRGFDTEGEQQTKTRTALEFFTGKSLD
jgi:CYTH domain